ncbi:MAG: hypothetical protein U0800_23045 [Isosphaeraceae bacterium]
MARRKDGHAARRLTLLDLTLIVAAAAFALAGFQYATTRVFRGWLDYSRWPAWIEKPTPQIVLYMMSDATAPLIPLAGAWTGLLPMLRLIPPAPSRRRWTRQPGLAACLSALVVFAWVGITSLGAIGLVKCFPNWGLNGAAFIQELMIAHVFPLVGVAVAATWFQMAISGAWKRPADWIDRIGLVVGVLWIVIGLAWTFRSYEPMIR